jgi:hypothetical protein
MRYFGLVRLQLEGGHNQIAGIASLYPPCQSYWHIIKCVSLRAVMEELTFEVELVLLMETSVL